VTSKANILFLDKEGGYGGSSRSLYFLVRHLDRRRITPLVALREKGPAQKLYRELGAETLFIGRVPLYKPSPRNNLWVLFSFLIRLHLFFKTCRFLSWLVRKERIDIVHMNHDGFFVYGFFLQRFTAAKILIHIRTMLPLNRYAAVQVRGIEQVADHLVFISENEFNRYSELLGHKSAKGSVVFNAFESLDGILQPPASGSPSFKVLYLGNLTYNKGSDRLIDLALEVKSRGLNDILFIVCGEDRGEKGEKAKGTVASKAERAGVGSYFRFMGHRADPDRFLQDCNVLIRPSRWNDPWGRDIIEAMAYGKPVLATGAYEGFVEHGVNGFLHPQYDTKKIVDDLVFLAGHPEVVERIGKANREKAKQLFDATSNAAKLARIYESLLRGPKT
jgi:glycosyltransferase involved in cell wall biosynthesis